ncbi:hypothetical protein HA402_013460 [Bradysia odoriphaga]|nr:hypothetical protein HA402_013460 [Bradysia odoriphaga]
MGNTESPPPMLVFQQGCFFSNGEESDETIFMRKFFFIYDEYCNTNLHPLYEDALASGTNRIDWDGAMQLRGCMRGITGKGYTAVIKWIVTGLTEIQCRLKQADVIILLTWSKKICKWRNRMIDIHRSDPDSTTERDGHSNALRRWKEVERVLKEFHTREIWEQNFIIEN